MAFKMATVYYVLLILLEFIKFVFMKLVSVHRITPLRAYNAILFSLVLMEEMCRGDAVFRSSYPDKPSSYVIYALDSLSRIHYWYPLVRAVMATCEVETHLSGYE